MSISCRFDRLLKSSVACLSATLLFATFTLPQLHAQAPKPAEPSLRETVQALDTQLFDAYNHCDVEKLSTLVADDLEFYHDKTGLSVGKTKFLADYKLYICGKVQRSLVASSLEVYPLNGYGAVEMGVHRFHHPDQPVGDVAGEAKFVMLWQNQNGTWKLTRVISYDHESLAK